MGWAGYHKVCRQVCQRLHRRLRELRLPNLVVYQAHLQRQYATLETLTDTTISRFCRDRGVFASPVRQDVFEG